ncbi:MAG: RibD family protein [Candidatus Zixiibacteriota bacterium]|nr:MAG: RibD family protein [candidate division Zixibacteria bacterium]
MKDIPLLTEKQTRQLARSLQKMAQAKYRKTGLPFVTLKFAQTLDGKVATLTGDSKWISGPSSLRLAHRLRSIHDAILVGVETIIRDDPRLTVRLVKGKSPRRIIADSRLRVPLGRRVLGKRSAPSTIIATTSLSNPRKASKITSAGADVWYVRRDSSDHVDLRDLLQELGRADIRSVLVEGGSKMLSSFLKRRLADYLVVVISPKIVGKGLCSVELTAPHQLKGLTSVPSVRYFRSGEDVILTARVDKA